jgi:MOSC domain-containing protein YiiM
MGRIIAVCASLKKGGKKRDIGEGILNEDYGLVGDAHAADGSIRQLSLLDQSSADKMRALGVAVGPGDFAENLTTEGLELFSLPVGTRLATSGGIILEVTQIGKKCHSGCAIARQVGTCVMPTEGVFVRVIKGGHVRAGDELNPI